MRWWAAVLAVVLLASAAAAQSTTRYTVNAPASRLDLTVRSPIGGQSLSMRFQSGTVVVGAGGQVLSAQIVVDATSMSGSGFFRDRLAGPSGLDIARHPRITFRATQVTQRGSEITINGDLTVRGVTRPVRFDGTISGLGSPRASLNARARIDRTAFGITAGRPLYSRRATVTITLVADR